MFRYIREKIAKHRQKRTFKEYGYRIMALPLPGGGTVDYAQWEHPSMGERLALPAELAFFSKYIKNGDFAVDIGAQVGDTTLPMALAAGTAGMVLSLEPNPHAYKIAKANSELNKDKTNITVLDFAATATDGEFIFGSRDASFDNGGIVGFATNTVSNTRFRQKVQGRNLENYLNQHYADRLPRLSFVKIDTEGYDKEVIKSIIGLLKKYKPTIITECFKHLSQTERHELYDLLADQGYKVHYVSDFADGGAPILLTRNDMMKWKHFDILATA